MNISHLFIGPRRNCSVDDELLEAIKESGISHFSLGVESGSSRILRKYSSKKWDPEYHDLVKLVREIVGKGFTLDGYFTIGYPDETLEELSQTFKLARKLVENGLEYASFYIVTPYPETALYEMALQDGYLPASLDLSKMKFHYPTMINTKISPDVLHFSRRLAYELIHPEERVNIKDGRTVHEPEDPQLQV